MRDRLFAEKDSEKNNSKLRSKQPQNLKALMSSGLSSVEGEVDAEMGYKGKPIADLFTESTVLFADIAGFTAWRYDYLAATLCRPVWPSFLTR